MVQSIDAVELAHLREIQAWRASVADQLNTYRARIQAFELEVHDADVMERGHLAFLGRKYQGMSVNPDGTLVARPDADLPIEAPAQSIPVETPLPERLPDVDPAFVAPALAEIPIAEPGTAVVMDAAADPKVLVGGGAI